MWLTAKRSPERSLSLSDRTKEKKCVTKLDNLSTRQCDTQTELRVFSSLLSGRQQTWFALRIDCSGQNGLSPSPLSSIYGQKHLLSIWLSCHGRHIDI